MGCGKEAQGVEGPGAGGLSKTTGSNFVSLRLSFLMWKIKMLEMVSKVLLQFSTPCFYHEYLPLCPILRSLSYVFYSRSLGFHSPQSFWNLIQLFSSLRIGT